jgi:hypothetical protein
VLSVRRQASPEAIDAPAVSEGVGHRDAFYRELLSSSQTLPVDSTNHSDIETTLLRPQEHRINDGKIAVLPPIPAASVAIATAVSPGARCTRRNA